MGPPRGKFIQGRDAALLWGEFTLPEKRRIEPVRVCAQGSWLQRLGGAGAKTKRARSFTPTGFAKAFHAGNSWTQEMEAKLAQWREAKDEDPGCELRTPFLRDAVLPEREYCEVVIPSWQRLEKQIGSLLAEVDEGEAPESARMAL